MMAAVPPAVLALAVTCLGGRRGEWALAMKAEFEAAREDGKALTFALGCLIAACRDLPAHEEGRVVLASHFLALAVIVPVTALMISSVLIGFPTSYLGHVGVQGLLEISSGHGPLLSDANRSAIPSLALLVLLLAALNLRIAWLALDRDWTRLAAVGAMSAAATATLVIFSGLVFLDHVAALAQATALTVELAAASALARWHARSLGGAAEAFT
jgi:hypothetical protein